MTDALILGRYAPLQVLGRGGMGEVTLARQVGGVAGADRLVVIKSVLPDRNDERGVRAFLDEVRIGTKLNHPNVVQVIEAGPWQGGFWLVMEYVRGDALSGLCARAAERRQRLPRPVLLRIAHDALAGLHHAHTAVDELTGRPLHVVHRDVSPQNIMVRLDGVTKIVDFGVARADHRVERTETGVVRGKLRYMSPEQIRGDVVDGASDQFSLGVVLWEALAGAPLFKGDSQVQLMTAVLQQPIPRLKSVVDVDAAVDAAVARMLARDPRDRFASCADAAAALGRDVASVAEVAAVVSGLASATVEARERRSASASLATSRPASSASPSALSSGPSSTLTAAPPGWQRAAVIGGACAVAVAVVLGVAVALASTPPTTTAPPPPTSAATPVAPAPVTPQARRIGDQLELRFDAPTGGVVDVDGRPWPRPIPVVVYVPVGDHVIVVDDGGARRPVTIALPAPVVTVTALEPGDARVFVDGVVRMDRGPWTLTPGPHVFIARHPTCASQEQQLTLKDGDEATLQFALTPSTGPVDGPPRRRR